MADLPSSQPRLETRRFSANIRWQFAANGSQAILGGAYLVVLGRFLGPADFGIFSTVTALVGVVGLLLEMRLQEVVGRNFCHIDDPFHGPDANPDHLVDLFLLELVSRLVPMLGLLLLSSVLLPRTGLSPSSFDFLLIGATAFVLGKSGSSVSNGLLRVLGRTDVIAACTAADWAARLLLTGGLAAVALLDVTSALWVTALAGGACNIAQLYFARREYLHREGAISFSHWQIRSAGTRMRSSLRLIASNLGVSASDLMAKDLDVALISGVLDPAKVGLYKMAKAFVQVMWRAIDPFYLAIMPEVQRLWQKNETRPLKDLLRKTSIRLFALALVIVGVGYAVVFVLGDRVLGVGFADVPHLVLIMSGWVLICAPLIWGIPLAIAINRPGLSVVGSVVGLLVGLVSFSTLVPLFDLVGCAIAWNATLVASFAFTTGLATWYAVIDARKKLPPS